MTASNSKGISPTVYPRVGFLGRFGWGGSGLATGSLHNSQAAARTSPRKKLGGFNPIEFSFNKFADPEADRDIAILAMP
jgi:hypothetical protein